jgi:hypothetical protein
LGASSALGCSQRQHPPAFELSQAGGAGTGGGFGELNLGDASTDAALCGDQQIPAISDPPNLYFVVDRSSSMLDPLPGSSDSKYQSAYIAIGAMLRAVGHRVRYGAAVFPGLLNQDGCAPGTEIFPTVAGDPPDSAANGQNGPNLSDLLTRLERYPPSGSTPTAASLRALKPTVLSLTGKKTYLVLMTDGAPNCNTALTCDVSACIPNIEHQITPGGMLCDDTFNCCTAKIGGDCVDADETEAAVAEYEAAGVDTYVVGMPGSEAYRLLLGRLALAGNTARPGATPYYAVSDTSQLSDVLRSIGAQVAISCDLPLAAAPDDPKLVNVYFDNQVVANDDRNGWHYSGDSSIQFTGTACTQLSSGDVLRVQVLSGCPTLVR